MKRFLSLEDLEGGEIRELLERAGRMREGPVGQPLAGRVLGLLMLDPSVRTLASFQSGMSRLGGSSFVIQPGRGSWGMEWRSDQVMDGEAAEHLREALPVLESYADALGIRSFPPGVSLEEDLTDPVLNLAAKLCAKPLINLESAIDHPCQALGDWKTLDDEAIPEEGGRFVLSWASHPRPLPLAVPSAVLCMAARRGMDVTVLRPDGYQLPDALMQKARAAAAGSGGSVRETDQRDEAMEGARVLYAKSWQAPSAYGNREGEAALRTEFTSSGAWTVDENWFDRAHADAKFMHCLPVRRNVVVADEILDGGRSRVQAQAANRLWVQMAVLVALLGSGT